jgi:hypothetical protein
MKNKQTKEEELVFHTFKKKKKKKRESEREKASRTKTEVLTFVSLCDILKDQVVPAYNAFGS